MKVLIIEDEKAAVRNLTLLLQQVAPDFEVIGALDSVADSLDWFRNNSCPDLIFSDIHLGDGSVFELYDLYQPSCPIIFTTAYDEYAIKAFKVNSIDYLLKPISTSDFKDAIDKFRKLSGKGDEQHYLLNHIKSLFHEQHKTTHFLVPIKGDKLYPLSTNSIQYFFIEEGVVKAKDKENACYVIPQTLDEIYQAIDQRNFYRANRQYIFTREAIDHINLWFNGQLHVKLKGENETVVISRKRVTEFKQWFSNR